MGVPATGLHDLPSGDPALQVCGIEEDHHIGRIGQFQAHRRATLGLSRLAGVSVDYSPPLVVSLQLKPVVRHRVNLGRGRIIW